MLIAHGNRCMIMQLAGRYMTCTPQHVFRCYNVWARFI